MGEMEKEVLDDVIMNLKITNIIAFGGLSEVQSLEQFAPSSTQAQEPRSSLKVGGGGLKFSEVARSLYY